MSDMAVQTIGLSKYFGSVHAVDSLDLAVYEGEILALVGPSGCGKTTLLRLIAGFERPDAGVVLLGGRQVAGDANFEPPERRGVGMVFQDYALFPHLQVAENVAFGLNGKAGSRRARVGEVLALVGLKGYGERYPHQLSGGERQRVALARALAPRPLLVLLDEPFSSLDADRRSQMREEVRAILKSAGTTSIFVTHDQEEALFMGDRLAVFNHGRLQQAGAPEEIFHQPATRFVADFMGDTDFLPGVVTPQGIHTEIGLLSQEVDFSDGAEVEVALRADDVSFEPDEAGQAVVQVRLFKGAVNLYRLELPSGRLVHSLQPHTRVLPAGARVRAFADPGHTLSCFLR